MFNRLQPILNVLDIAAETQFYVRLGFSIAHQSEGFVALAAGETVLFGLKAEEESDPIAFERQMFLQFGVASVGEVARHCEREGIAVEKPMELQAWGEWMMVLRSPGGYRVAVEGPQ